MAERIIDHFGENTIDILDNNPDRLREVKGISQGKLESIRKEWAEQQQTRQIFVYLQGHGLSYDLSARLIGIYGKKIIAILKQQPYLLAREINGIGFKRADQIASQMGIAPDSPMRIEAGIDYALYEAENCEGHCYLPFWSIMPHRFCKSRPNRSSPILRRSSIGAIFVSIKTTMAKRSSIVRICGI